MSLTISTNHPLSQSVSNVDVATPPKVPKRLESLFKKILKPQMDQSGETAVKVSRREYTYLPSSYFVTIDGQYFRQLHETSIGGAYDLDKKLVGFGGYKNIYDLENPMISMVRGVYRDISSEPEIGDKRMQAFAKKHRSNPHLAIDHYIVYKSAKYHSIVRCYLINKMDGTFYDFDHNVSLKKALCMTLQFMKALSSLKEDNLILTDLHSKNILVKENLSFPGGIQISICDFDDLTDSPCQSDSPFQFMDDEPLNFFNSFIIRDTQQDIVNNFRSFLESQTKTLDQKIDHFSRKLKDLETT